MTARIASRWGCGGFEFDAGLREAFLGGLQFGGDFIVGLAAEAYGLFVRAALGRRLIKHLVVALEELVVRAELADEHAPALDRVDQPLALEPFPSSP